MSLSRQNSKKTQKSQKSFEISSNVYELQRQRRQGGFADSTQLGSFKLANYK
jgi:hypothetical protein